MFHEGEKQNLSKTLVRHELLCFPGGEVTTVSGFDFSRENSTEKRFVLRKKHKKHNIIRLTINKRGGI